MRPSDDVGKSDKLNSGIRRLILQSFPELEENSEELPDIFSWNWVFSNCTLQNIKIAMNRNPGS